MLADAEEKLQRDGIILWLAALNPHVFTAVTRSRIGQTLGRERMFFNLQAALERYQQLKVMERASGVVAPNAELRRVI
jgi:hypothetical protein